MQRSQQRNAAAANKFFFRRNVFPLDHPYSRFDYHSRPVSPPVPGSPTVLTPQNSNHLLPNGNNTTNGHAHRPNHERESSAASSCSTPINDETGDEFDEMTLDEVINGNGDNFPGLMGVVNAYLNSLNVDVCTKCDLRKYLDLIKYRAKGMSLHAYMLFILLQMLIETNLGDLVTPATWIRRFITSHPTYKKDSIVNDEINYDLVKAVDEMYVDSDFHAQCAIREMDADLMFSERGVRSAPELLGKNYVGSGPTGCL